MWQTKDSNGSVLSCVPRLFLRSVLALARTQTKSKWSQFDYLLSHIHRLHDLLLLFSLRLMNITIFRLLTHIHCATSVNLRFYSLSTILFICVGHLALQSFYVPDEFRTDKKLCVRPSYARFNFSVSNSLFSIAQWFVWTCIGCTVRIHLQRNHNNKLKRHWLLYAIRYVAMHMGMFWLQLNHFLSRSVLITSCLCCLLTLFFLSLSLFT